MRIERGVIIPTRTTRVVVEDYSQDTQESNCQRVGTLCQRQSFLWLLVLFCMSAACLNVYNHVVPFFCLILFSWLISLCLHEFGHAIVAYYGGDTTVIEKGYLTLDVFRYTNVFSTLLIPALYLFLGGIALPGGAVYIEQHRIRSRGWLSASFLAGPAMNLLCALAFASPFWFMVHSGDSNDLFWAGMAFIVFTQLSATIINSIPLPPFDGFGAIMPWMPEAFRTRVEQLLSSTPYAILVCQLGVFLIMWRVPFFGTMLVQAVLDVGVPRDLLYQGISKFRLVP